MFQLRCMPGQNMTQAEMERQCQLVSNAAEAMERLHGEGDDRQVLFNPSTLECKLEGE